MSKFLNDYVKMYFPKAEKHCWSRVIDQGFGTLKGQLIVLEMIKHDKRVLESWFVSLNAKIHECIPESALYYLLVCSRNPEGFINLTEPLHRQVDIEQGEQSQNIRPRCVQIDDEAIPCRFSRMRRVAASKFKRLMCKKQSNFDFLIESFEQNRPVTSECLEIFNIMQQLQNHEFEKTKESYPAIPLSSYFEECVQDLELEHMNQQDDETLSWNLTDNDSDLSSEVDLQALIDERVHKAKQEWKPMARVEESIDFLTSQAIELHQKIFESLENREFYLDEMEQIVHKMRQVYYQNGEIEYKESDLVMLDSNSHEEIATRMYEAQKQLCEDQKVDYELLNLGISHREYCIQNKKLDVPFLASALEFLCTLKPKQTETETEFKVPSFLQKYLKPHQLKGVEFMWKRVVLANSGCILAHAMGLGKSFQIVTFIYMLHLVKRFKNFLIVCPKTVLLNWSQEIEKWIPRQKLVEVNMTHFVLDQNIEKRAQQLRDWVTLGGIMITSYDCIRISCTGLEPAKIEFRNSLMRNVDLCIFDEAHIMKNKFTVISTLFHENLVTPNRIALTGTPLQNNLKEYHNMTDLIHPGFLGPLSSFKSTFVEPIERGLIATSTKSQKRIAEYRLYQIRELLDEILLREDQSILQDQIPAKYEYVLYLDFTFPQKSLLAMYASNMSPRQNILKMKARMTQIYNHPLVFRKNVLSKPTTIEDMDLEAKIDEPNEYAWVEQYFMEHDMFSFTVSSKLYTLVSLLKEFKKTNEKCLVFSHSVITLEFVGDVLSNLGIQYLKMDGQTSSNKRHELIQRFNQTMHEDVFLISTKAGGMGVNLVAASRVVILDFQWNPADEEQAIGRAYRLGQTRPVFVYRLVMIDTIESCVFQHQLKKSSLSLHTLDKRNLQKILDSEDTQRFISADYIFERLAKKYNSANNSIRGIDKRYMVDCVGMESFFPDLKKGELEENLISNAKTSASQHRQSFKIHKTIPNFDLPDEVFLEPAKVFEEVAVKQIEFEKEREKQIVNIESSD